MTDPHQEPDGSGGSRLPIRAMTYVLLGLSVLALIAVVAEVVWLRPRHLDWEQERADRAAVLSTAQRFATMANTYTPDDFDEVFGQVQKMLTTKFRKDFQTQTDQLRPTLDKIKLASKGVVLKQGLVTIDDDSAAVLVVADADVTSTVRDSERHFRWQVNLVKVKGTWLVDDFEAVQDPTVVTQ